MDSEYEMLQRAVRCLIMMDVEVVCIRYSTCVFRSVPSRPLPTKLASYHQLKGIVSDFRYSRFFSER